MFTTTRRVRSSQITRRAAETWTGKQYAVHAFRGYVRNYVTALIRLVRFINGGVSLPDDPGNPTRENRLTLLYERINVFRTYNSRVPFADFSNPLERLRLNRARFGDVVSIVPG